MNNVFEKYNFNVWLKPVFFISLLFLGDISATEIVILYAIETIVVGLFHLLKMFLIAFFSDSNTKKRSLGIFYMLFFCFHYGIFVFVQTTFFFVFLSMEDSRIVEDIGIQNFKTVLQLQGFQIGLLFMVISYALRFWFIFFTSEYYKTVQIESYIFQPYLRIFIQQFVAIIPGFFIIFGKAGFIAAILLIIIRAVTDFYLNKMRIDPIYFQKGFNFLFKKQIARGLSANDRAEAENFVRMMVTE